MLDRRSFLGVAASALLLRARGATAKEDTTMLTRPIPKSGEALPVVGLGTYSTFDVAPGQRAPLVEVMRRFLELGGRVIDSSPMYNQAEAAVGDVLGTLGRPKVFLATKVWVQGKAQGEEQMARSAKLLGAEGEARPASPVEGRRRSRSPVIDLMQIHNLLDWRTHLPTLQAMKADGRIRYIGVTHYATSAFGEIESIMKSGAIDFIQIPYSIVSREAEKRILPAAADQKVAVLVMEPFERGSLFERVKGKALPAFATELGCASWAQLFLKFIIGHPAVTAPIPATANVKHLEDNVAAGRGPLPSDGDRKKMAALL
jgi:aryl-alcohol dehydrogenase-like predicted oxidoreductase